jgi:photosystem II stability/assembly factor-like uncharacterized protein
MTPEQVLRTLRSLWWAMALVIAMLGTGSIQAHASINEWTSRGPFGGAIKALAIDPQKTSTMYAATYDRVFKTIDGAASWMPASTGLTGYSVLTGLAIDPQNTSTLYSWGIGWGALFKSTDSAANWNSVLLPNRFGVSDVAITGDGTTYVTGSVYGEDGPPRYSIILKTVDGGATWNTLTLPQYFFAQRVAIDPQSPSTVYVAGYVYAGDPAAEYATMLRSVDAGANWITGGNLPFPIFLLVPDPRNPGTLYVGTFGFGVYSRGRGVYKSTDGGATWNAANSGFPDGFVNALALAIDPGDSRTLYAVMGVELWSDYTFTLPQGGCCLVPGRVFKSTDAGESWSAVQSGLMETAFDTNVDGDSAPLPVGLAIDPSNSGTVYLGTNGDGIFKSTDGGADWNAANVGLTAMHIDAVAVDPQHESTIYAATWTRFFKSEDGGLTWRSSQWGIPALFVSAIAIDPQNPSTIYAGADSQEDGSFLGGVFRSMDGGTSWSSTSLRCPVANLAIDKLDSNTLYAGTNCGLYKTTDGGESWNLLDTGGGSSNAIAIARRPAHHKYGWRRDLD